MSSRKSSIEVSICKYDISLHILFSVYNTHTHTNKQVVLDEAHERSIHTDILIGLLKREIETSSSSNFRVVISSATLDSNKFSKFFHNAPIVKVSGRTFPVDVIHTRKRIQTRKSVIDAAIDTVIRISEEDVMGHVLLFLSGQNEIERMCRMLRQQRLDQVIILPLYGALRSDQQQDVFRDVPRNVRKVIVCTNIAETSITIPGIRFVIDCGFEKRKVYDADRRIDSLISTKISKTSAMQRAGRAGRTGTVRCCCLYLSSLTHTNTHTTHNQHTHQQQQLQENVIDSILD